MTEKPVATTPKKGKWLKRVAVTAFALAVGALALDDLGLRLENEELATGVDQLLEENGNLQQQLDQKGGGDFIVIPRDNNRTIEISAPATRVVKPAVPAGQTI